MVVPYFRRFSRGNTAFLVQRCRGFGLIVLLATFGCFLFFNFYPANSNEELALLRIQYNVQKSELKSIRNELIDANVKMNSWRNAEFECRSNIEALETRLKSCCSGRSAAVKPEFGHFQRPQQANANAVYVGSDGQWKEKPQRGDLIPNKQWRGKQMEVEEQEEPGGAVQQRRQEKQRSNIGDYPQLSSEGTFIPSRLWLHIDFKGAPPKPAYFLSLLPLFKGMGINGLLLEWEDQFPYSGKLASAISGDAYSMDEVEQMLQKAKDLGLEIVPLVQTFGHLEWVLKRPEFVHLREDPKYPQVICFGAEEAWELLEDMISQVAEVHKRFGMAFFHIGADEVFQVGVCNESLREMSRQGGRDGAILWHISRTAQFVRKKYSVTVLAWHDMLVQMPDREVQAYKLPGILEPVLWSYAEDLDAYLPYSNWISLKSFKNVWGASAFKGADGPARFNTNPMHYIRNHEAWIDQMTRVYREFERFQGLIITGWSRYDHLAVLCELLPVALPTLAMSAETILAGRPLNGLYEKTGQLIQCQAPLGSVGFAYGCKFPGKRIYELINEFASHSQQLRKYTSSDYDFNGWLSPMAERWNCSSPMYIEKVLPYVDFYLQPLERIERELRAELPKLFYAEVAQEWMHTYMQTDLALLRGRRAAAKAVLAAGTFPRRPFVKYPAPVPREESASEEMAWRRRGF